MLLCKHCGKECKNENSLRNHQRLCKLNSTRQSTYFETNQEKLIKQRKIQGTENQYTKAKKLGLPPPSLSDETRKKLSTSTTKQNANRPNSVNLKISNSMKKAHAEGRAWNIGKSRWNNEPSWPEKFFMEVIENEFVDKNYTREHPVGIYSIDFAWVEKKLAIEIDGDQHQRFESYKNRDLKKDQVLRDEGWQVLRIIWKDMFHDTKKYIKIAKDFDRYLVLLNKLENSEQLANFYKTEISTKFKWTFV